MSFWDQELEGGSGGGIESFSGRIIDAYFSPGEYGASLMLKAMFDDPENYPTKEDGTYTMYFKCREGWVTLDDGNTVVHESGDDRKFHKNSGMGILFEQMKKVPGLREAAPDFSPYDSRCFKGLHLEFARVPVEKNLPKKDASGEVIRGADGKPEGWETVTENVMLPVGLVGGPSTNGAGAVDLTKFDIDPTIANALGVTAGSDVDDKTFMEELVKAGLGTNGPVMAVAGTDLAGLRKAFADGQPF